ncbi:MAG: hypothetical protein ACI4LN_09070 [Anaerovoracaceae bacterium]
MPGKQGLTQSRKSLGRIPCFLFLAVDLFRMQVEIAEQFSKIAKKFSKRKQKWNFGKTNEIILHI